MENIIAYDSVGRKGYISEALAIEECMISNLRYKFRNLDRKRGYTIR
jgi:hypothetical protein